MDRAVVEETFAALGPVEIKRLFSGHGIYRDGLIVGAVMDGEILLKADVETEPLFVAAGATQWTYEFKRGTRIRMPYWTIPTAAVDDAEQLAVWVRRAFDAARRAPPKARRAR
jgi:DNA transformation protein